MTTKTYTLRNNAHRAAKKALGENARAGVDFDLKPTTDGWIWEAITAPVAPAPSETDGDSKAWTPFADEPAPQAHALMDAMNDAVALMEANTTPTQNARAARRQRLIAAAQDVAATQARTPAKRSEAGPRGKMALILEMLTSREGCTREEILAATGWPSVSVQQCAKSLKLELVVDKTSRPFRYRTTAAAAEALAA